MDIGRGTLVTEGNVHIFMPSCSLCHHGNKDKSPADHRSSGLDNR